MAKQSLSVRVLKGAGGVSAECVDFGLSVNASSERLAKSNLRALIPSYCRTLLELDGSSHASPEQLTKADAVKHRGFAFRR